MGSFKNTKGGGLSFTKILSAMTGKRAVAKSQKTVKGELSYSLKSKYALVATGLAAIKEWDLKSCDVSNAAIIKMDVETGDQYSDAVLNDKVVKFTKKVNKGKLNLGAKTRIATSSFVTSVSDSDAIDRRVIRLKDDDEKTEAKAIKTEIKDFKVKYSDYKREDLNRHYDSLAKYSNDEFLERIKPLVADYIATLTEVEEEPTTSA